MNERWALIAFVAVCFACMIVPREEYTPPKPKADVTHIKQYGAYQCWSVNDGPYWCSDNPPGYPINKAVSLDELKRGVRP